MSAQPSWREVANRLADRMYQHARCPHHPVERADPDCPFCEDRAAYRAWEAKSGQTHREIGRSGTTSVIDVFRHAHGEGGTR